MVCWWAVARFSRGMQGAVRSGKLCETRQPLHNLWRFELNQGCTQQVLSDPTENPVSYRLRLRAVREWFVRNELDWIAQLSDLRTAYYVLLIVSWRSIMRIDNILERCKLAVLLSALYFLYRRLLLFMGRTTKYAYVRVHYHQYNTTWLIICISNQLLASFSNRNVADPNVFTSC